MRAKRGEDRKRRKRGNRRKDKIYCHEDEIFLQIIHGYKHENVIKTNKLTNKNNKHEQTNSMRKV